jgi:hypothetical protein
MKGAGRLFITGFLKSLLFFGLFLLISVSSYKIFMRYYGMEESDVAAAIPQGSGNHVITEPQIDVISRHLIYCVDEETGDIQKLVLEVFDCERLKLNFITIPVRTQITLPERLHKELVLIKPSIPGFLKLSAITGYLPEETVYEYGVRIIEEMLGIKISYYSVVPQSVYDTVFETKDTDTGTAGMQGKDNAYPAEVFSDAFLEHLHSITTESQLYDYLKDLYGKIQSNLSFEEKLNYMESYIKLPGGNISFSVIPGEDTNSGYIIDEESAAVRLKALIGE